MDQAGFFKGDTMMEVFTVLANSGTDVKTVRDTVILYIARKKQKGRSEQHIQDKLSQLEDKFKHIEAWHPAFRDARALFQLPKSKHIPLPKSIIRKKRESELLSPILDIGPVIPSPPQSPSFSSPTPSSWDGPPLGLQDMPYVLPTFSWEDERLGSRVHVHTSPPGQMISSDVLSLLSNGSTLFSELDKSYPKSYY